MYENARPKQEYTGPKEKIPKALVASTISLVAIICFVAFLGGIVVGDNLEKGQIKKGSQAYQELICAKNCTTENGAYRTLNYVQMNLAMTAEGYRMEAWTESPDMDSVMITQHVGDSYFSWTVDGSMRLKEFARYSEGTANPNADQRFIISNGLKPEQHTEAVTKLKVGIVDQLFSRIVKDFNTTWIGPMNPEALTAQRGLDYFMMNYDLYHKMMDHKMFGRPLD